MRALWRLMDEQCVATCREQQDNSSRGRIQQVVEVEPHSMYGGKSELEPAGGEKHEGRNTDSVEEIPPEPPCTLSAFAPKGLNRVMPHAHLPS